MNGKMKMPQGCSTIEEEEMMYVEGGTVAVSVDTVFLNKSYCRTYANRLLAYEMVKGMTQQEIAEELFAHAVMYYANYKYDDSISQYFVSHSREINIADGGDSWARKYAYKYIWNAAPSA